MVTRIQRSTTRQQNVATVRPSKVDPVTAPQFTLEQELEPFGTWNGDSIWVPPKSSSTEMAECMLANSGLFASREQRWSAVVEKHSTEFTQVREIELKKPSIRLPRGKLFVSVTEREHFDQITDTIPGCVQTRLEEFLDGPGKKEGVKVYYLKPLCVEVADELVFTTHADVVKAIEQIQEEVFAEYRRLFLLRRTEQILRHAAQIALAVPRGIAQYFVERKRRAIRAYQAQLEFTRRKTALRAARAHRKSRTDGCTFEEMLAVTKPLNQATVVELYGMERKLSRAKRARLMRVTVGTLPWFMTLSMGASSLYAISLCIAPPLVVCDPAFVAEMPDAPGVLLKIGHFDEVGGVTHIEI